MLQIMKDYGWHVPFLPMNAKDSTPKLEAIMNSKDYVAEKKLDGSRYYVVDGRFFSRRLSVKDKLPVEKTGNVPHLALALGKLPKGTMLDGEVYYHGENSMRVTSIMGALPAKAIARQEGNPIRYCSFDILMHNGKDVTHEPWHVRRALLEKVHKAYLKDCPHIDLSEVHYGDKHDFLAKMFEAGEEGIMLKNINAPYQPDKRPEHTWYKVKRHMTTDVIIVGFEDGKGKYEGQIGSIVFGQYKKKGGAIITLGSCSGITDAMRLDITKNRGKYLGKVMEISAMEQTKDGFFRHPQFVKMRIDKGPEQCIVD